METLELVKIICAELEEKKGEDILLLDVQNISSFADYFIIVSADSERGVTALARNISRSIKKNYKYSVKADGLKEGQWVIIDFKEILIHFFHKDTRKYYDIESLWTEAKNISLVS
tara:strand:- start:3900 stop:4244 length:345 start_codon:yes stop_codon:yes gene_type:complete